MRTNVVILIKSCLFKIKDQYVKHYRFSAKARLFDTSVSLNCTRAPPCMHLNSPFAWHAYGTVNHEVVNEWANAACSNEWQRHRQWGKASRTGLPGYVQSECVLKHATRAAHFERVLVLGLIRADVLFTRRWNLRGKPTSKRERRNINTTDKLYL